jgi:hypothetical protein
MNTLMNELCAIVSSTLFEKTADLNHQRYKKLSTDTTNIVFNVPYLTMSVIEESDRWVFIIKMTIKDNRDFFDSMKMNGFVFKDDIETDLREKFDPIHQQKDVLARKFNIHVNYVIEHMFYFSKENNLYEQWSSCTHDLNGAYLFLKVERDTDGEPIYSYFGYHHQNLLHKTYKNIQNYEFCVMYLQQKFYEKGHIAMCDEITYDNVDRYFELLNMVEI